jgi:uncharacterized protein
LDLVDVNPFNGENGMEMTGEERVSAPRQTVWSALNDPEILKRCIPGCQSLELNGDHGFLAVVEVKIGPIGARFKGDIELSDLDAPNGYTITGSGSAGIAGSAKGGARVRLSDAAGGTLVSYSVQAEVGGRMAQLGGAIIDATAKNLAGKFFKQFGEVVSAKGQAVSEPKGSPDAPSVATVHPGSASGVRTWSAYSPASLWSWIAALVVALLAGFSLGHAGVGSIAMLGVVVLLVITGGAAFEAGKGRARQ